MRIVHEPRIVCAVFYLCVSFNLTLVFHKNQNTFWSIAPPITKRSTFGRRRIFSSSALFLLSLCFTHFVYALSKKRWKNHITQCDIFHQFSSSFMSSSREMALRFNKTIHKHTHTHAEQSMRRCARCECL